ncbi:MAG TPA: hypothetical protein VN516_10340 [Candidatus Baltobacteraceae bacterium]|nr:hypothetical protein [Candidatus Baltobacteraceae bacterium]
MNRRSDKDKLLNDVLGESSLEDFRGALLAQTLQMARRRRHVRQAQRTAGVFFLAILAGYFLWKNPKPSANPVMTKKPVPRAYRLVQTKPLPTTAVVTTHPFSGVQAISSSVNVVLVTTEKGDFRFINDNELLALLAQRPAALIRTGPDSEELIFANPEDQKGFRIN